MLKLALFLMQHSATTLQPHRDANMTVALLFCITAAAIGSTAHCTCSFNDLYLTLTTLAQNYILHFSHDLHVA